MTEANHIAFLLYKELEGNLSEAELRELESWKAEDPGHTKFFDEMMSEEGLAQAIKLHHPENKEALRERILRKMEGQLSFKVVPLYRRGFFKLAAAAVLIALTVGGYFLFSDRTPKAIDPIAKADIEPPKTNKAKIELPDGTELLLDTLTTFTQNGVTVTRTEDGRVIYTGFGDKVVFNTLTNPRGNKVIDIELADKSHVWLNAGSSITYPVAFTGNERKVTMTGEAYFEITHDQSKPFIVSKDETMVTVLGTKFNVNTYDDESNIRVTLLDGAVKVSDSNLGTQNSKLLKPGQQAQIGSDITVRNDIDLEEVMAWKNGQFTFNRANIETIMREVSRYYNVEVKYEGKIPGGFVADRISRDLPVSTLLQTLEKTNRVHFKIEGNKITVRP